MPYPNEHSARLLSPSIPNVGVRRTHGSGRGTVQGKSVPESIDVIWFLLRREGRVVPAAQALRFPIKTWTAATARRWLSRNEIKFISFEPATGKQEKMEKADLWNDLLI